MHLAVKPRQECRWDLIALGEVMLRFDPGDRRIWTARSFDVCEGGGEYNVARGLKRCFGLETAIVTALPTIPWADCSRMSSIKAAWTSHCVHA